MKKLTNICLFTIAALLITGCQKSQSNRTTTQKPNTIQGYSALFDENSNLVIQSGTTVSVENSTPSISVTADSAGQFSLPLFTTTTGAVTLVYAHPGFGTMKQYFSQSAFDSILNGTSNLPSPSLYAKSSVVVNSLSGQVDGDTLILKCNVSVPQANTLNAIRFFIQKNNPQVSYDNCTQNGNISRGFPVVNGDNTINVYMPDETNCGFQPGDTLYLKAYGDILVNIGYVDVPTGKIVKPCVNTNSKSSTISFVIP